jgi:hypothetical protein
MLLQLVLYWLDLLQRDRLFSVYITPHCISGDAYQSNVMTQLKQWSKHEVQTAIQFLNTRNMSTANTNQPVEVYK